MSKELHAIVVGANGLVGAELTKLLLEDNLYSKVTLVVRRYLDFEHEKLETKIVDFRDIHKDWNVFVCDHLYYCLGTTKSKTSKSEEYQKVEFDYCINIAKIAHHNKVNKFLYISSSGASPNSWFTYLSLKGRTENALIKVGFESLHIFRPYVLIGPRSDFRFWESIVQFVLRMFNFLMVGFLKNIKGMPANQLARAMIHNAKLSSKGVFIHSNKSIHDFFPKK
ncbi:MAG: NAD-dependent epimerase/dehydratase family protein [Chitinophagales bacterium]|nr:NAD-dependent epimerase/dehydratase family protein [Chitinophagales bacterium]